MAKRTSNKTGPGKPKTAAATPPRPARPRKPRAKKIPVEAPAEPIGATEEIRLTEPERAPLPDPTGLAHTLSPVDLPEPAVSLPHPLRWATTIIAVATLFLFLFNAHALRGWSYQLPVNDTTASIVQASEAWYDIADGLGLNRPVEAMHDWWQGLKDTRFGEQAAPAQTAAADRSRQSPRTR